MERYKRSSESLSAYVSASAGKTRRSKVVVEEAATGRVWRNEIGCEFISDQARGLEEQQEQQEGNYKNELCMCERTMARERGSRMGKSRDHGGKRK